MKNALQTTPARQRKESRTFYPAATTTDELRHNYANDHCQQEDQDRDDLGCAVHCLLPPLPVVPQNVFWNGCFVIRGSGVRF